MKYSFATYLGTDSFLPGILVLNESISKYNKLYGLVVLVSESVSKDALDLLAHVQIKTKVVAEIKNPHDLGNDDRGFKYMYTKLRLFEMFEFDKVVYIDADMLVCGNIEQLFDILICRQ
ncbi:MAG: nucleotide-diphospho-sugar transferase [Mucilaginibacter sp.]|nr:nucleotide-diphospho-sugar transferase [Mucilaginibacter sp.]